MPRPGLGTISRVAAPADVAFAPERHVVQLYEQDHELVLAVGEFLATGLRGGEVAVVVAMPAHVEGIEAAIAADGIDLGEAREEGRYLAVDANETLSALTTGGDPDSGLFVVVVGGLIDRALGAGRPVRVYGEMVAVLWDRGNVSGG